MMYTGLIKLAGARHKWQTLLSSIPPLEPRSIFNLTKNKKGLDFFDNVCLNVTVLNYPKGEVL